MMQDQSVSDINGAMLIGITCDAANYTVSDLKGSLDPDKSHLLKSLGDNVLIRVPPRGISGPDRKNKPPVQPVPVPTT